MPKSKRNDPGETTITSNILTALRNIKGVQVEKTFGGMFGTQGKADLTGCVAVEVVALSGNRTDPTDTFSALLGVRIELEVKRPDGDHPLTDRQAACLITWAKVGAFCAVVTSPAEAVHLVALLRESQGHPTNVPEVWVSPHANIPTDSPLHRGGLVHTITL